MQTSSVISPDSDSGGYDCDFVQSPHDDLLCKICHFPARDAFLNVCCGNSFCKFCLDCYLKSEVISHSSCPYCREENFQSVPDKKTARYVLNLQVYCPNRSQGCDWVGELKSLEDHSSNGCLFIKVCCSNQCGVIIQRRLLRDHLKLECELRQVKCQYCDSEGSYQWINSSHQQECPKYPMECPNHCEVGQLRRENIDAHLEVCPLAIVTCPFAVVGCDSVVRRQEKMGHMKEAVGKHVECNKEAISELIRAKTGLEERLKAKENELAEIKSTTESLKRAINEKGKELDDLRKTAEKREKTMQEKMKLLKEMFEKELQRSREETNVGAFSNSSLADYFVDFTAPEELQLTDEIKPEEFFKDPALACEDFKPLVKLADVAMSSGEENDVELFSNKAKLYRFDKTVNQWKERGVGSIKILKHKNTGRIRILMRRDQVLKICCNHMIVKGMKLVPRDEKSFTWLTLGDLSDLSCGEPRAEIFTVKFKSASTATSFQEILFNNYAKDAWMCHKCSIQNEASVSQCVACGGTTKNLFPAGKSSVGPIAGGVRVDSTHAASVEGETHSEAEANIYFHPIMPLPTSFSVTSEKENEVYAFAHKAKLFTLDRNLWVWKDRGIEIIKILRNKVSGQGRVLMRREQVLKLCCNHYIVPGMALKPGSLVDRSWIWFSSADLSEDTPQEEIFCVKFKLAETAGKFKRTFDTFTTSGYTDASDGFKKGSAPINRDMVVGEELPGPELVQLVEQSMLPPTCYNEEEEEVVSKVVLPGIKIPQVKPIVGLFSSGTNTVSFADLAAASTGSFGSTFGGSGSGNNQGSFASAGKPLFATQTDNDNNNTPENFESTVEFKPVVKLPSNVTLSSGEENELELFSNRAKLYRFDETVNQWKERGVGNMKLLKHKNTGRVRILMRRDQVLKICCNHVIVKGMKLIPRDEKSFNWIALSNLSDGNGEPKTEKLAVKFKLSDTATAFQNIFNSSLAGSDEAEGSLDIEPSANVKKNSNKWECQACYSHNKESVAKCAAGGGGRGPAISSGTCSVTLSNHLAHITTTTPPAITSSNVVTSIVSATSLPATTVVSALPNHIFVFGRNSQPSQSFGAKPTSGARFSLSPPKFAFGMSTFKFKPSFQVDTKLFPGFGVNNSGSEQLQHSGNNTESATVDSQSEKWLSESGSESLKIQ